MARFTSFQNILPDPNNSIGDAGQSTGSSGAGFSGVTFTGEQPYMSSRTNSGRLLARATAAHKWKIKITYNPMTREDFQPIYLFLLQRRGPMNPFYVSLPQYRTPQDSDFASYAAEDNSKLQIDKAGGYTAGQTVINVDGANGYLISTDSTPQPGDMFTIDGTDSNHEKAYLITRVETPTDYFSGDDDAADAPDANNLRLHFVPPLARDVDNNDDLVLHNPLVKVIRTGNIEEYKLNNENLYSFSLNLEEVQ